MWGRRVSIALVLCGIAACKEAEHTESRDPRGNLTSWVSAQDGEPTLGQGDPSTASDEDSDDVPEPVEPPCTIADNDQSCAGAGGEQGVTHCIGGKLQCWVCEPGEVRAASCPCGVARRDVCGEDGKWRAGACDGCVSNPAPIPCGFCGHVDPASGACVGAGVCTPTSKNPASVRFERCDDCPLAGGCAPGSCIGKKFTCSDSCEWQLKEDCGVRAPQCDGELRRIEKCGVCGDSVVACDGCFWDWPSECDTGQQECQPGTRREVECFANSCAEGYGASISCGNDCRWSKPTQCQGCTEGLHQEWQDCVYAKPACGKRQIEYYCDVPAPDGACDVPIGTRSQYKTLVECPPIDCYPGQVRSQACMLADGRGGFASTTCGNDCQWPTEPGACTVSSSSCTPGASTSEQIGCGCGISFTRTKTCNATGTGWVTNETGKELCPECKTGDSTSLGCTASGSCGTQSKTCNAQCKWELGTCNQASWACTAGQTKQASCSGSCGAGTATFTCVGCSWMQTTSCFPSNQPECSPGQTRETECRPGVPECGTRSEFCGSSCQWVAEACGQCG